MTTYVAFLRGINVGGHTVKNDRLRELFEDLGFEAVQTFLASGNVIFACEVENSREVEERAESRLREGLGYNVPTFVRTSEELFAVADHAPFPHEPSGGKLHVGFLREEPDHVTVNELAALTKDTDRVAFRGRELYWQVAGRFMDSALSEPAIGKVLDDRWTLRTAQTVQRLAAKLRS
ncbi:MAG: DUF1697 domain-containing protein [Nitriliruptorales bacterium]